MIKFNVLLLFFNIVWIDIGLALQFKSHQTFPDDEIRLTPAFAVWDIKNVTTQESSDPQSSQISSRHSNLCLTLFASFTLSNDLSNFADIGILWGMTECLPLLRHSQSQLFLNGTFSIPFLIRTLLDGGERERKSLRKKAVERHFTGQTFIELSMIYITAAALLAC